VAFGVQFFHSLAEQICYCMCVLSYVCISAYANVYFKTTTIKQNIKIILIAEVPSSQAVPGFLITAPPSVCVPEIIGVLAVWISNQKKKKCPVMRASQSTCRVLDTYVVCAAVFGKHVACACVRV